MKHVCNAPNVARAPDCANAIAMNPAACEEANCRAPARMAGAIN